MPDHKPHLKYYPDHKLTFGVNMVNMPSDEVRTVYITPLAVEESFSGNAYAMAAVHHKKDVVFDEGTRIFTTLAEAVREVISKSTEAVLYQEEQRAFMTMHMRPEGNA